VPLAAQIRFPCVEALWWLAQDAPKFGVSNRRLDCGHYRCGYLILDREHVLNSAIVTLRPDVIASRGINELRDNADPAAAAAHAAL
jgi:hypothetical protein